ncbi:MAG: DUF4292 domain-containing protein [Massilibacteroides sp.]|nr:DUF4292 domain-containing protein [Massilibacteroides sp.]
MINEVIHKLTTEVKTIIRTMFLLLILSSCVSSRSFHSTLPVLSRDQLLTSLSQQEESCKTLRSSLKAHIKFPEKKLNLSMEIRLIKDSILWISVRPLFGIEVARILYKPNQIIIIDRIHKCYAKASAVESRRYLPAGFDFYSLSALVLHQLFLPGKAVYGTAEKNPWRFITKAKNSFLLADDSYGRNYSFEVDGKGQLRAVQIIDFRKEQHLNWSYEDYKEITDANTYPREMKGSVSEKGKALFFLQFDFSKWRMNQSIKTTGSITSKYRKINIEEMLRSCLNEKKEEN